MTVTDKVPIELMTKMQMMGIDTSRIKVVHDNHDGVQAEQKARNMFRSA